MTINQKKFCHFCGTPLVDKFIEGRLRRFCETCAAPLYENPVPATCSVVVDGSQRILLVKRSVDPKKGLWCLPGGFLELGETPEQGAIRELGEETGLKGKINTLLGVTTAPSDLYGNVLMLGYYISQCIGSPVPGDDASDLGYFARDDLPEVAFDSHAMFIRIYYSAYSPLV